LANAYRCGVVAMVRASGNSSPSRDAAVALMRDRNQQYDTATLELDLANTTDAQIDAWLTHLSVMLNALGKERFFSGMVAVARADGAIDEAERSVLERVGRGLLLTPAQLHGLLDLSQQDYA
jgi:tellurite resistance protein